MTWSLTQSIITETFIVNNVGGYTLKCFVVLPQSHEIQCRHTSFLDRNVHIFLYIANKISMRIFKMNKTLQYLILLRQHSKSKNKNKNISVQMWSLQITRVFSNQQLESLECLIFVEESRNSRHICAPLYTDLCMSLVARRPVRPATA